MPSTFSTFGHLRKENSEPGFPAGIFPPMPQPADSLTLLEEMIGQQREKVLELGRRWVPYATDEDLRNAEDFAVLKDKPIFHFEDGILAGLIAARMALTHQARAESEVGPGGVRESADS
jgi:hypothetical protein